MSPEVAIQEAEAFVRKAIARISDVPVDEATIKLAATKVAKIVPSRERGKEARAA
jgi:hypothetical protein